METIHTKYYGPTNYNGARIKAQTSGGEIKIWFSYDYSLNVHDNHCAAAKQLKEKMDWQGEMVGGDTKDGLVFVFADDFYRI